MQCAYVIPDLPVPDQLSLFVKDLHYNILKLEHITFNDKPAIRCCYDDLQHSFICIGG